ncbi:hypothetical protein BKA70DRAFT_1254582 [Coprinopsis sp. MPI-PUGE-AT-0042]|nr:hypothetical protein BKA70DRAFT_1254582 [Coprinopsis sp. MPI-PUGE-AT-0042]
MTSQAQAELDAFLAPVIFKATPLPPNPYDENTQSHSAYEACLTLQEVSRTKEEIMHSRVLGYLLIHAPVEEGRGHVANEILMCGGNQRFLYDVAMLYVAHLLQLFRKHQSKPPTPASHPSIPSSSIESPLLAGILTAPPSDHRGAKKAAIYRDGHQCLYSGSFDRIYSKPFEDLGQDLPERPLPPASTYAAHIFPPSLNTVINTEEGAQKTEWSGSVVSQVHYYASIDIRAELNGPQMHRLGNVLTLAVNFHGLFDNLEVWFEKDKWKDGDHHYIIQARHPSRMKYLQRRVTFSNAYHGVAEVELPNSRYLELHAAVCRIAHLSGAAEYLDEYDRHHEEQRVLASDGSSAGYLEKCLNTITTTSSRACIAA